MKQLVDDDVVLEGLSLVEEVNCKSHRSSR